MGRSSCSYLLFLFILLLAYGCKKKVIVPDKNETLGYDYYPLQVGKNVVYEVEEITIDAPVGKFDTIHYFLKEEIIEVMDSTKKSTYKMERYTRNTETDAWEIRDVWTVTKSNEKLIRNEENIPIVKLVFPLSENKKWNANQYNTLGIQEYEITGFDQKDSVTNIVFQKVASVSEYNFESLFEKHFELEKYSRNVGLIFRQLINVESQTGNGITIDVSKPIMDRITMGTIVTWKIKSQNYTN